MDGKQAFLSNYVSISSLLKLWSLEQPGSLLEMQILTTSSIFTRSSVIFLKCTLELKIYWYIYITYNVKWLPNLPFHKGAIIYISSLILSERIGFVQISTFIISTCIQDVFVSLSDTWDTSAEEKARLKIFDESCQISLPSEVCMPIFPCRIGQLSFLKKSLLVW